MAQAGDAYEEETQDASQQCTADLKAIFKTLEQLQEEKLLESCSFGFDPFLVDDLFDTTTMLRYTSSIFATTAEMIPQLYESVHELDKETDFIKGAYDTQCQYFVSILAEEAVGKDMILATASGVITTLAILVHTRCPCLTLACLLQICPSSFLSFGHFIYIYVSSLTFFPFLNFIGVFVGFALGAGNVFVAVDKTYWKNDHKDHPDATTEQVAAVAFPGAAYAMLLTTSTPVVAFFGTAIFTEAPIRVFAIFSGLLVSLDYAEYITALLILYP